MAQKVKWVVVRVPFRCVILTALLFVADVHAEPRFVGSPEAVDFAELAWRAGVSCAGFEARHHETVEIVVDSDLGILDGRAMVDSQGLSAIRMAKTSDWYLMSHEVAHAWVFGPPAAFTEGVAEMLSACMSRSRSVSPRPDDGGVLEIDLLEPDAFSLNTPQSMHDAYRQSWRFARSLEMVVPISGILRTAAEVGGDWSSVMLMLSTEDARLGDALEWWARVDGEMRAISLSDGDLDGVPCLGEWLIGTDPTEWDTDGDGWWDGSRREKLPGALPLKGGTPICFSDAGAVDSAQAFLGSWNRTLVSDPRSKPDPFGRFGALPRVAGGFVLHTQGAQCVPIAGVFVDPTVGRSQAKYVAQRIARSYAGDLVSAIEVRGETASYEAGILTVPSWMLNRGRRKELDDGVARLVEAAAARDHRLRHDGVESKGCSSSPPW